jgi:integrase
MGISRRGKKGLYQHFRRVPKRYQSLERRTLIRTALHTTDENLARHKAAEIETLQDQQWESLLAGRAREAERFYDKLREVAAFHGVTYIPAKDTSQLPISHLLERVEKSKQEEAVADALLGAASVPKLQLSSLFQTYETLIADRLQEKSPDQLRRWRAPRQKSIKNLMRVTGDLPIEEISREQALRFRAWWWQRVESGHVGANSANKDITYLSSMINTVAKIKGWNIANPFAGLRFKEQEDRRLPFSTAWINDKILAKNQLDGLNEQARDILLIMINTGARPSEIIDLHPHHICLDDNIPHIVIKPEGRSLKTKYSNRSIPLIGVSLEAMRRQPNGFPRYRGKATTWSSTVTKYLRENKLLESENHTAYSLRHALSDRLQNAGCEDRTRKEILGHRPEGIIYGSGASLSTKSDWLSQVAL